jgi:hypothetical protein
MFSTTFSKNAHSHTELIKRTPLCEAVGERIRTENTQVKGLQDYSRLVKAVRREITGTTACGARSGLYSGLTPACLSKAALLVATRFTATPAASKKYSKPSVVPRQAAAERKHENSCKP